MVLVWVPLKIVSDSPALHSRWLLLLKIEISSIVHCCFSISQNNCSYMARSSLAYVRCFCLKFFFQPIYTDYANLAYFDKRSHLNLLLWNRWTKWNQTWQWWSLGGSLSKLCPSAPSCILLLKIEISSNGQNCSILSQNVPKFEMYKHNDEVLPILTDYAN